VFGLVAGVSSSTPHRVLVDMVPNSLSLTWFDPKVTGGADTYSLAFSPAGSMNTVHLFSMLVGYGVLPTAPDIIAGYCSGVAYTAQVELTQPIDFERGSGGAPSNSDSAAGAAGDGGSAGDAVQVAGAAGR
jgi:hypothetical protein